MITVLQTDSELEALRTGWDALWQRTPDATPFQSPHWMLPWWHHFGTGHPRIAVSYDGGDLKGVLPLYLLPAERKALPIGVGNTDYLDILGDPDGLLLAALNTIAEDPIDSCDFLDIRPGSALVSASAPGWRAQWQDGAACPVLALPSIPKLARRKLSMNRHRADRAGGWSVDAATPTTIRAHLDTFVRLHQIRWTAQGQPGVLAAPQTLAFWREAAPDLIEAGLLRMNTLHIAGEVAAGIVALLAPGRIYFYLSGFDDRHAFVSPGTILLGAMLDQAIAEGRTEAHFLRGRESYKYRWGAIDRFNQAGRYTR